jgi:hypothetical protein
VVPSPCVRSARAPLRRRRRRGAGTLQSPQKVRSPASWSSRANEAVGLTVKEGYDRDAQNLIQRSDNWPFLKRGIPALFFTTGLHPDYHTPDDDTDRLELERISELASRLAWLVADGQPPRFKQTR